MREVSKAGIDKNFYRGINWHSLLCSSLFLAVKPRKKKELQFHSFRDDQNIDRVRETKMGFENASQSSAVHFPQGCSCPHSTGTIDNTWALSSSQEMKVKDNRTSKFCIQC